MYPCLRCGLDTNLFDLTVYGLHYIVIWMKTTIDISDGLFASVRKLAARNKTTFKSLVEIALRRLLDQEKNSDGKFKLRNASVRGKGLQPPLQEGDWATIRDMIYLGDRSK